MEVARLVPSPLRGGFYFYGRVPVVPLADSLHHRLISCVSPGQRAGLACAPHLIASGSTSGCFFLSTRFCAGRRAGFAKVFLAAVAQPYAENLRDFLPLFVAQALVKGESLRAFAAAGPVVAGIPVTARHPNATAGFLDQRRAGQGLASLFLRRHECGSDGRTIRGFKSEALF